MWLHLIDPHAPFRAAPDHLEVKTLLETVAHAPEVQADGTLVRTEFGNAHGVRSGELWFQPADRRRVEDYYDGAVRYTDTSLARLFDALRAWDRDVVVVLTADHGEEFWDHGGFEHGHDYYAEVTRVPLIFWGVGVSAGRQVDEPVGLIDVGATVGALAGLSDGLGDGTALTGVAGAAEQDLPLRFC